MNNLHISILLKKSFRYHNKNFYILYDIMDTSGLGSVDEIVKKNEYKLDKFINNKNKILIDIGANIGVATIIMAKLNPESIVYSFEPYKKAYDILIKNLKLNNLSNVIPFNMGVTKNDIDFLKLNINYKMSGASSTYADDTKFSRKYESSSCDIVKCTSLDKLIEKYDIKDIHLLKIDCEGAEFDIIYGSEKFKDGIIKNIVGEFHDLQYNNIKDKSSDLVAYCKKYITGIIKISILRI